jgi:hypothetical protein
MPEDNGQKNMEGNKKSTTGVGLFNQQSLVKNIPFFLYLACLAILYIYNGHRVEKTIKDISKISKELKEYQFEFKMLRSEWMLITKQSEVVKAAAPFGLIETDTPPVNLELKKNNK